MNDQQLKLAIARERPQVVFSRPYTYMGDEAGETFHWRDNGMAIIALNDREWLAVMWEVERYVNGSVYSDWLEKITGCGTILPKRWTWNASWQQRAEAYLCTIGKYEEQPK